MGFMNDSTERSDAPSLVDEVRVSHRLPTPRLARAIRESAHVSQVRLAAEIGVHRLTLVRWERGTSRPRGASLAAYVELLERLQEVSK